MSSNFYRASAKDFQRIPGSPIAYWAGKKIFASFTKNSKISDITKPMIGMRTGDNERFLRLWFEISLKKFGTDFKDAHSAAESGQKWFPYNKGGKFRKWYGNNEFILNWENNGYEVKSATLEKYPQLDWDNLGWKISNEKHFFKPSITWTATSSSHFGVRSSPTGYIFDVKGSCCFPQERDYALVLANLASKPTREILKMLNPTIEFQPRDIGNIPHVVKKEGQTADSIRDRLVPYLISLSRSDWDNYETSWDFNTYPLLRSDTWSLDNDVTGPWKANTLETSWNNWKHYCDSAIARMQELETENNSLWIDAYGLQDELTPEVPEEEITLARADKAKDMAAFLSYAVGCMMGRFSLDADGLIIANSGETLEGYLAKVNLPLEALQFAPDDDGIIPVLDDEWFDDDIVGRTKEFLRVTFGDDTLKENVDFIEQSLGKSLRKYFCTDFYKNHISNERAYGYKKRPIYWLVQSPKKSFQALIYLHRYTRDTMNLVLNNYLREFEAKLENRLDHLAHIITSESSSGPDKTKAQKETDKIKASLAELDAWEKDILFPIASQRIELDLDDGVKANYPKLGKTLAKIPGVSKK